uniref:FKB95-like N-terminal Kelch domain-containing protein n=1 Tax=Davidia involucrata TaxID=16924 RepID=A0A5B7BCZ0_DAVIN
MRYNLGKGSGSSHFTSPPDPSVRSVCFTVYNEEGRLEWFSFPIDEAPKRSRSGDGDAAKSTTDEAEQMLRPFMLLPNISISTSCAALGSSLYCIGGTRNGHNISKVRRFDTARPEQGWITTSPMTCRRSCADALVLDGKIYVIGGTDGNVSDALVEVYDPPSDTWRSLPPPPSRIPEDGLFTAVFEESKKILVASEGTETEVACLYDVNSDSWQDLGYQLEILPNRTQPPAAIGNTAYWYHIGSHVLGAHDLDLKKSFTTPIKGLEKVGVYSLLALDDDGLLCLIWIDHLCHETRPSRLHCTKVRVSTNRQGVPCLSACVESSKSYLLPANLDFLDGLLLS